MENKSKNRGFLFMLVLIITLFVLLGCSLTGTSQEQNNNSDTTTSTTNPQSGAVITTKATNQNAPTATLQPKKVGVPTALDKSSSDSVIEWMDYAIANSDVEAMNSISAEKVAYVVNIAGGDWQDKSRFLNDFSQRIGTSKPKCVGRGFSGDGFMYVAWFSGWTPAWGLTRSCGDECTTFNSATTSDIVGFIFDKENGAFELIKVWIGKPDQLVGVYPSVMGSCPASETVNGNNSISNSSNSGSTSSCPGAPVQRVKVGNDAHVCTKKDSVAIRNLPARDGDVIIRLIPGATFTVIGGPKCSDNWSWWQIRTDKGTTGWISEGGDSDDPYYICP